MKSITVLAIAAILASCATSGNGAPASAETGLSTAQKAKIGRKIWQNESGGKISGLTAWNSGEEFPSLGIGHFIWYPAGFRGPFEESWPAFITYAGQRGANPPEIARGRHSPWTSRVQFQREFNSAEMAGLRSWLAENVSLQTDFIITRSRAALGKILAAAPASERGRIQENYRKVATTPQGTYALIDYVNFKGEGVNPAERYNGCGWGLMQVLGEMRTVPAGPAAAAEFAAAAKRVLTRRIENSPPARGERKWLPGWHNRCDTYARPL